MKRLGEGGFTLLNALLELMVLMIFLPLVALFFGYMIHFSAETDVQTAEWHLFTADFQSYLHRVDSLEIINNGGGVRIVRDAEEYDIELYDRFLRKQKFRQGHEIMLTDIKGCRFTIDGNKLSLRAEMSNGTVEQAEYVFTHSEGQ
ncbi:competence type IV pilus minor pilin ComGF [Planococcus sp. FY231025]|uniref:competence type IV pilus minor pilin ComGF n=1 Tax=Planococcus sp. FY231025 TaxID=3455699 RepID=UPI003F8EA82F